jgi:hypothetical protein
MSLVFFYINILHLLKYIFYNPLFIYILYNSVSFYQNFVADKFIYRLLYTKGTMKTTFAILGIIAAVGLVMSIATPNAFALTQISGQGSSQSSSQTQAGISVLSPQTSLQGSGQSSIQAACLALNVICG